MYKFIKFLSLIILAVVISACAIITNHDFVYLGHPPKLYDYQIYYDKTQKLYLFIDKHGCFDKSKNGSGTCIALSHQEVDDFIKQILPQMVDTEQRLERDDREKIIEALKKYNKKYIKRPAKIEFKARPVKQINVYGKKEYHLVPNKYEVKVNLIVMLDDLKHQHVRVLYSIRIPRIIHKQKTSTKPFLIDPEYLEKVMNEKAIKEFEEIYNQNLKKVKERDSNFEHFLDDDLHI